MATKIYGCSDDLIEVEGDVRGEGGHFDQDSLLACSDGTILSMHYGKPDPMGGVWAITVLRQGELFDHLLVCYSDSADPYSDIAFFRDGLMWVMEGLDPRKLS